MSGLQAGMAVPDFTLTTFEAEIGDFGEVRLARQQEEGRWTLAPSPEMVGPVHEAPREITRAAFNLSPGNRTPACHEPGGGGEYGLTS